MIERTLSIIKPDGVSKGLIGEIIKRFENNKLRPIAMKMAHLSKKEVEGFYIVHKDKPFYKSLTEFMSSGSVVLIVLEGEDAINKNRELMGTTNPANAAPGTIRADFASDVEHNIVHGSDSQESAAFEIPYFFSVTEIVG